MDDSGDETMEEDFPEPELLEMLEDMSINDPQQQAPVFDPMVPLAESYQTNNPFGF